MELTGQLGGATRAVAVEGKVAYFNIGPRVAVADVANPAAPALLATTEPLEQQPVGMAASGTWVYVITDPHMLQVLDAADPRQPRWHAAVDLGNRPTVAAVVRAGSVLWVVGALQGHSGKMWALDLADPSTPKVIANVSLPQPVTDVAISGTRAYVSMGDRSAGNGQLGVLDIANPAAPVILSTIASAHVLLGVASDGRAAFAATDDAGLVVYDVTDVSDPMVIRALGTAGYPGESTDVVLLGDFALVTVQRYDDVGEDELRVLDVHDRAMPRLVGRLPIAGTPGAVVAAAGLAYVAGGGGGLQVADLSAPATPSLRGTLDVADYTGPVFVDGGIAYVADRNSYFAGDRLAVVDLRPPDGPRPVGAIELRQAGANLPSSAVAIVEKDGYVYVTTRDLATAGDAALQVVDARDSAHPAVVAMLPGPSGDIAVAGGFAYVADQKLTVVDVRTPTAPHVVASADTPAGEMAGAIAVDGPYAYVAGVSLTLFDIRTPLAPRRLSSVKLPGPAVDVSVAAGNAYMATDANCDLFIANVTVPSAPAVKRWSGPGGSACQAHHQVHQMDRLALEAGASVLVLDARVPAKPEVASDVPLARPATGVHGAGGNVAVATDGAGLFLYSARFVPVPASPTPPGGGRGRIYLPALRRGVG